MPKFDPHEQHRGQPRLSRRQMFAGLLGLGAVTVVDACAPRHRDALNVPPTSSPAGNTGSGSGSAGTASIGNGSSTTNAPPTTVDQPGPPEVIFSGDDKSGTFALTFDDGTCSACAAEIVGAVQQSGVHATFSPNGYMGPSVWDAQSEAMAAMVATGQVSICNHTWDHKDLTKLKAGQIETELLRNDEWIHERFGTSSRPFYRPPYGFHDLRVDDIAGNIGFTKVIMWNGTFGDSIVHPPAFILQQLQKYLKPGTIMLGHANHPATASVIDQIIAQVNQSGLRPVTLLELLGTAPTPALAEPDRPNHPT